MVRLVTKGKFTQDYVKGLVARPEDREAPVRKLIEAAGLKLLAFYFTTGPSDFMLITEGEDAASAVAALMAASASGAVCDITTERAWTGAEFKAVAAKAAEVAGTYRAPG
jgi:uncharacterized protein with GYD domain